MPPSKSLLEHHSHPFVRSKRPSLRPDLAPARALRAGAVEDAACGIGAAGAKRPRRRRAQRYAGRRGTLSSPVSRRGYRPAKMLDHWWGVPPGSSALPRIMAEERQRFPPSRHYRHKDPAARRAAEGVMTRAVKARLHGLACDFDRLSAAADSAPQKPGPARRRDPAAMAGARMILDCRSAGNGPFRHHILSMTKTHPHAEATYRVISLPKGGAFGVEVAIPDRHPTTVSEFATEADAEAWIARHKSQVSGLVDWRFRRKRSGTADP